MQEHFLHFTTFKRFLETGLLDKWTLFVKIFLERGRVLEVEAFLINENIF